RDDLVRLIVHAVAKSDISGPINATAPIPVRNMKFTEELGRRLHRPAIFRIPAALLRHLAGDFADELLLGGERVIPNKALSSGFVFWHETLPSALPAILYKYSWRGAMRRKALPSNSPRHRAPECCGERPQRGEFCRFAHLRIQHHFGGFKPRQPLRRSHVDHTRWRDPPRQRCDREPGESGRHDGRHAAADEALAPLDASLLQRTNGERAHPAWWRQRRQLQLLAATPLQLRRGEPAELVLGQFLAAAPAAFLPHDYRIQFALVVDLEQVARKTDGHRERKLRGHRMQLCKQRNQLRTRRMIADAER